MSYRKLFEIFPVSLRQSWYCALNDVSFAVSIIPRQIYLRMAVRSTVAKLDAGLSDFGLSFFVFSPTLGKYHFEFEGFFVFFSPHNACLQDGHSKSTAFLVFELIPIVHRFLLQEFFSVVVVCLESAFPEPNLHIGSPWLFDYCLFTWLVQASLL